MNAWIVYESNETGKDTFKSKNYEKYISQTLNFLPETFPKGEDHIAVSSLKANRTMKR